MDRSLTRRHRHRRAWLVLLSLAAFAGAIPYIAITQAQTASDATVAIIEDFSKADPDGFPQGWQASRSETITRQAYQVQQEGSQAFLKCKGVDSNVRIFKRMAWDTKTFPVVSWRWRLHGPSTGTEPFAAVFISLDQDFFGIPINTKYLWSPNLPKGTVVEGGLFRPSQVVLRSGAEKLGEWVEERVNAYEDFKRIHKHEPAPQAWGISLVAGPGVEIDFGPIAVARQ
jgi:Protein of unknown function (DUF3047)